VKLPFALLLSASVIFLSGVSESADSEPSPVSQEIRPDKFKDVPKEVKVPNQQQSENSTPLQTQRLEAIRAIANEQKTANEQNDASQKSWYAPSVLINIGILIAVAIYTVFAGLQWAAIRKQANIALQQANTIVQQQRPWLTVTATDPENWPPSVDINLLSFPLRIDFGSSVKNTGNSPAFLTQQHINVVAISLPIPDDMPPYSDPPRFAEMIIPPNGIHAQRRWKEFTREEFESIMAGKQCIMFYGFVRYFDSLRQIEHQTRFCSYWHKRPQDIGTTRWSYMPVGPPSYIEYT